MSTTWTPTGALAPRQEDEPGLERRERHRLVGPHRAVAGFARAAVHTRGDVDRQHGRAAGIRRVVVATEPGAVGGVDDEIDARESGALGGGSVDHLDANAAGSEPRRRVASVVAVVALARDDDDAAAVRPAHHPDRVPRDRRAGASDQHLDGLGSVTVDRRHLFGGDDRLHRRYSTATTATATASEWLSATCQAAGAAFGGDGRSLAAQRRCVGSPDSARSISTSWKPNDPRPTPSAFITASFAAKRTA